jgi:uncharacterized repeat protein (TIGR03803 family)
LKTPFLRSITRRVSCFVFLGFGFISALGQEYLYGVTHSGGAVHNAGAVYRVNVGGTDFASFGELHTAAIGGGAGLVQVGNEFVGLTESDIYVVSYGRAGIRYYTPYFSGSTSGNLLHAFDGRFFGCNWTQFSNAMGTIFRVDYYQHGTPETFVDFDGVNKGRSPKGSLVQGPDMKVFGMTEFGGVNDQGVIFSVPTTDPDSFKKLFDFNGTNGANPVGSLLLAQDGFLYGMTKSGGSHDLGVIFKIAVDGTNYTKLLDFDGTITGSTPLGSLVEYSDGKLYGTTSTGGANGFGTIFHVTTSGVFTNIVDFNGTNGKTPTGDLVVAPSGTVMYGTAYSGGSNDLGTLYKIENGSQFTKLYDYTSDAGNPIGALAMIREKQQITFPPLPTIDAFTAPFIPQATSPTGRQVYFRAAGDVVRVKNNMLSPVRAGTGFVLAYNSGNFRYLPAADAGAGSLDNLLVGRQPVTVSLATQTISIEDPGSKTFGDADFDVLATTNSNLPLVFASSDPSILSVSGARASVKGAGTVEIKVTQPGDASFSPATLGLKLTIEKADQIITYEPVETAICCGQIVSTVSTTSDLQTLLRTTTPDVGYITFYGSHSVVPKKAGKLELIAYQGGNKNYNPAELKRTVEVVKATQTIYVAPTKSEYTVDDLGHHSQVVVYAAGGKVKITSDPPGIATIEENQLYITGFGETTLTFTQEGSDGYEPAATVTRKIKVSPPATLPTTNNITWNDYLGNRTITDKPFNLTGFASSGLPITYVSNNPTVVSISGSLVTFQQVGTAQITASQPGNASVQAATPVSQTITIGKTTDFDNTPNYPLLDNPGTVGDPPFYLVQVTLAGRPITYTSSNENVITVVNDHLNFVAGGAATLTIDVAESERYVSAHATIPIIVNKMDQKVSFDLVGLAKVGDTLNLNATASSGLPITYSLNLGLGYASIDGNHLIMNKAGRFGITATQQGDSQLKSAVNFASVLITKGIQTVNVKPVESKTLGDSFTVIVSSTSPNPITLSTSTPAVVTITGGNRIRAIGNGTATIIASQAETPDYLPAQVELSFPVVDTPIDYSVVGTLSSDGPNGTGIIFKANSTGSSAALKSFAPGNLISPFSGFVKASDGKLYGNTFKDGDDGAGQLVRVNIDGSGYTAVFNYVFAETGGVIYGEPTEGSDGYLYSTTTAGGKYGRGTITKVAKDGSDHSIIHDFTDETGEVYGVMQASDGRLYGVSRLGGFKFYGAAFSINSDGSDFKILFTLPDAYDDYGNSAGYGFDPTGKPVEDADGVFYINLFGGGSSGFGSIISFDKDGNSSKVLGFSITNGGSPNSTLLLASDGKLYGVASFGGQYGDSKGVIFSVNTNGSNYSRLYEFSHAPDGESPNTRLTEGLDGMIYGTTPLGGVGYGTTFRINKDGSNFTILHTFTQAEGSNPVYGGLIETGDGTFIGSTTQTVSGSSLFYKIAADGSYTVLNSLASDYAKPEFIVPDNTGEKYYGTVTVAKPASNGAIYSVRSDGTDFKEIMSISNGGSVDHLFYSSDDHVWGIANGKTLIFRMKNDGSDYQTVAEYEFTDQISKGWGPIKLMELNGFVYGMTGHGGTNNRGTLFRINLDGTGFTKIADLPSSLSGDVEDFTLGSDGKFYGVSPSQPTAIFSVDVNGTFDLVKEIFNYHSSIRIIELNSGDLAICSNQGDKGLYGEITLITKDGESVTPIYNFKAQGGREPLRMLEAFDGWLYVLTNNAAANGNGELFKVRSDGTGYSTIMSFNSLNGDMPRDFFFIKKPQSFKFDPIPAQVISDKTYTPNITSTGTPVLLTSSDTSIAVIESGVVKMLKAGIVTITASQFGNANFYAPATTTIERQLTIGKGDQTISFTLPKFARVGDDPIALNATASSGLPITFTSSSPFVASIVDKKLVVYTRGNAMITASQAGSDSYNSAASIELNFNVYSDGQQQITFSDIDDVTVGGSFTLGALATSGLPVAYSTNSENISIAGSIVNLVSAGHATINANQDGNEEWFAAETASQTFCVNPAAPLVTSSGSAPNFILTSSNDTGNQWYKDGQLINGATEIDLSATSEGHYTVITTVDGCNSRASNELIVVTGLDDDMDAIVEIYPNPATTTLFVKLTEPARIQLINNLGVPVIDSEIHDSATIDIRNLTAGLYIARIEINGKIMTKKVLKQ